jgi:hypothetical protein
LPPSDGPFPASRIPLRREKNKRRIEPSTAAITPPTAPAAPFPKPTDPRHGSCEHEGTEQEPEPIGRTMEAKKYNYTETMLVACIGDDFEKNLGLWKIRINEDKLALMEAIGDFRTLNPSEQARVKNPAAYITERYQHHYARQRQKNTA